MNYSDPIPIPSSDDTRTALLAAARELFAEQGYDGASVRAITSRAGANLGAITYHFGSKEELYLDLLTSLVRPLRDRIIETTSRPVPPLDRLGDVVDAYFEHLAEHPDLPRFLLERIASGQPPPAPVAAVMGAILQSLSSVVAEGQADGSIRPGNPILQSLSLIAQPIYLTLVQTPLRHFLGLDLSSGEPRQRLVAHAREFVRAGLAADLPEPP